MPKNASVVDLKPQNEIVSDILPRNKSAVDTKPQNRLAVDILPFNQSTVDVLPKGKTIIDQSVDQLYSQVLTAGMYIGIPGITYAETGTVQSPFSP